MSQTVAIRYQAVRLCVIFILIKAHDLMVAHMHISAVVYTLTKMHFKSESTLKFL